jgi:hypothetical protein
MWVSHDERVQVAVFILRVVAAHLVLGLAASELQSPKPS